jgi:hypothetical protein
MKATVTLKGIPEELQALVERSARANFRSENQELLYRISSSYDAELSALTRRHQAHIDRALASGPVAPLDKARLKAARERAASRSSG